MYRTSFRTTGAGLSLWPQPGTAAAKTRLPLLVRQPVMMMMKHELQSSPRRSSLVCFSLLTLVIVGSHWARQVFTGACKLVQTSEKAHLYGVKRHLHMMQDSVYYLPGVLVK
jgi:hypothetical protein